MQDPGPVETQPRPDADISNEAGPALSPRLVTVGLSHRTATAGVRGRLSFTLAETEALDAYLGASDGIVECAVLSTCNRTEIYAFGEGRDMAHRLVQKLADWRGLDAGELRPYLYFLEGREGVRHLFRVASGLDSMVVGEAQILGQVKRSFTLAREIGAARARLLRLSEHAVAGAKNVRNRTGIGGCPVSLAGAAAEQVKRAVEDPARTSALVIGAGENAELIVHHLSVRGADTIWIANRTQDRARRLAERYGATTVALGEIDAILAQVDVVVSSTASAQPILDGKRVKDALPQREGRELVLLDLAIPRDIALEAGELPGVHLFSADDLGRLARQNIAIRREAAEKAETLVDAEVSRYQKWLRERTSVPAIRALRERAEEHRREALTRAMRKLRSGMPPEEALVYLSQQLSARLLHTPTKALSRATSEDAKGDTVRTLIRLLDLEGVK